MKGEYMQEQMINVQIGKRSDLTDYLKAIAIILVVLGHSFYYLTSKTGFTGDLTNVQTLIYTVHVPLFFVIAGYLCHPQDIGKYLQKKVYRLLVPFFFFASLKIIYTHFVSASFAHAESLSGQVFDAFVLGRVYWFPYVLFICYVLSVLFWNLSYKQNVILLGTLMLMSVIQATIPGVKGGGWFGILFIPKMLSFFLFGYVMAQKKEWFLSLRRYSSVLCVVCFFIIVAMLSTGTTNSTVSAIKFFVMSFSEMFLTLCGMHWIKDNCVTLKTLAKYSLQIMFLECFFRVMLFGVVAKFGLAPSPSVAIVVTVITVALSVVACKILEKNTITAKLIGL